MTKIIFLLLPTLIYFSEILALNENSKWEENDWFGQYYRYDRGWIFHPIHLWQFTTDEISSEQWVYDTNLEWIFTGKNIYPYIFSSSLNRWIYFSSEQNMEESYFDFEHFTYRSVTSLEEMIKKPFVSWIQGEDTFHYIDNKTGITLTLYNHDVKMKSMLPNFRGVEYIELPFDEERFSEWKIEYFCEPDWVIVVHSNDINEVVYLNELKWEREILIEDQNLFVKYYHEPSYGYIYKSKNFPFIITIEFFHEANTNLTKVSISIESDMSEESVLTFVAQDAAYMWFPNNDQSDVFGILIENEKQKIGYGISNDENNELLAGTFSAVHGVFSGFKNDESIYYDNKLQNVSVGVTDKYLLVPEYIPIGYQYIPSDLGKDFSSLTKGAKVGSNNSDLINRFLIYRFYLSKSSKSLNFDLNLYMQTFLDKNEMLNDVRKL